MGVLIPEPALGATIQRTDTERINEKTTLLHKGLISRHWTNGNLLYLHPLLPDRCMRSMVHIS